MSSQSELLSVQGAVTMDTVPALFEQGLQQLQRGDLLVDFKRIEALDSAAVGVLLAWQRAAQAQRRNFQVANAPDNLLSLARLYGVEDLLPKQA